MKVYVEIIIPFFHALFVLNLISKIKSQKVNEYTTDSLFRNCLFRQLSELHFVQTLQLLKHSQWESLQDLFLQVQQPTFLLGARKRKSVSVIL